MLTIHVWPKWLKEFLLTHPLYKSPYAYGKLQAIRQSTLQPDSKSVKHRHKPTHPMVDEVST